VTHLSFNLCLDAQEIFEHLDMTVISSRSIPDDRTPTSYDGNDILLRPFTAVVNEDQRRITTIVNNNRDKSPLATSIKIWRL
jgi:hypothetical protein